MKRFCLVLLAVIAALFAGAQVVTTTPVILQEGSQGVVLTYHADSPMGNMGLANLSTNFDVYVHIGVITNKSTSDSDWKYVVAPWPNGGNQQQANIAKNRLTRTAPNTYTLQIGDIRTYFGITSAAETVKKIAMVFRTADGSQTGRGAGGADILVDVLPDGFAMRLSCDRTNMVLNAPTSITFTAVTSIAADIKLAVNGTAFATKNAATELVAAYNFADEGEYKVTATATYGGKDYTETIDVSYPKSSPAKDYPGGVPQMGTVRNADGSVTFCLAAPGKNGVVLVGAWDDYEVLDKNVMNYQDYKGNRYFWTTVTGLADNEYYPYFYIVDDTYKVADPYAHLVLDCYNDRTLRSSVWPQRPKYPYDKFNNVMMGVYRGDLDDFTFSDFEIPDKDNLVIYEMLLRDFTCAGNLNGLANGWGTAALATEKIPYIKAMGFNAIELMPIMEFNGNNSWGYNTNFYMAPDKTYGSPDDYKTFIETCHQNGIAVILDIVFNQSDGLHPWYQMYPIDTNPFYNKTAPHQWSVLNDWKQDNDLVQQQWTDAIKYWMTAYNVDGFRFDLVKGLGDNGSYTSGTEAYNQSRIDRMKRLHDVIVSVKPKGIHINENLAGTQEEIQMGKDGELQWANINGNSSNYAKGSGSMGLSRFYATWDSQRPWGSTVSYAESHDEQRVAYNALSYGETQVQTDELTRYRRLGALAAQMLLVPGPKMVWQFGELGNDESTKDASGNNNTSPKIVDWRWLDNPYKHYLMQTYAAVINMRMANPELFGPDATFNAPTIAGAATRGRTFQLTAGDKEIIAFINPSVTADMDISTTSAVITPSNAVLLRASQEYTPALGGAGNALSLRVPANCFAIYVSASVAAGAEAPEATEAAYAIGRAGAVEIIGEYTTATVYDLSGRICAFSGLRAGVYIVNIDGRASKVSVH